MSWTAGEPDAVVLGRLRNASVVQGLAEERVRVVLQVRTRLEIKTCAVQHLVGAACVSQALLEKRPFLGTWWS